MAEREFTITNQQGLHARPAAMFVKTSSRFQSEIWVTKDGEQINGKSIMGLMMLAAEQGAVIQVSADGSDAEEALDSLQSLIEGGFKEEN